MKSEIFLQRSSANGSRLSPRDDSGLHENNGSRQGVSLLPFFVADRPLRQCFPDDAPQSLHLISVTEGFNSETRIAPHE